MSRTVEALGSEHLPSLPGGCGACLAWQVDAVAAGAARSFDDQDDKREMVRDGRLQGVVVRVDGIVAGHLAWATHAPRAACFPTAPVSDDAVVLVGLSTAEPALGRVLVQRAVRELWGSGVGAVEAFGGPPGAPGCLTAPSRGRLPCRWPTPVLERLGFHVVREHPVSPRLRLEVRRAVPSLDQLGHEVGAFVRGLRLGPTPDAVLGLDAAPPRATTS